MKRSRIYREAAKLIASRKSDRSCWAVEEAQGLNKYSAHSPERAAYTDTMLDGENDVWRLFGAGQEDSKTAYNIRILALLFMSHIAEDEEQS